MAKCTYTNAGYKALHSRQIFQRATSVFLDLDGDTEIVRTQYGGSPYLNL